MKNTIFTGIGTAIVTPMKENGELDLAALDRLLEFQIAGGVNAIVVCGTTGESATLTVEEHQLMIRHTVEKVGGRVPVVAGTGANCTQKAIDMTRYACQVGVDGCLLVTPYYNKATQSGLVAHYTAIADAATKPVILYNVPSRTGCNLLPETAAKLAKHGNIAALKEASGNISQIAGVIAAAGEDLEIYSGNDDQMVPIMALGGIGCISVLSNVAPELACGITGNMLGGNYKEAARLQLKALPLCHNLFSQVNPIPVKAALARMGLIEGGIRLPLTPMEEPHWSRLEAALREEGLIG